MLRSSARERRRKALRSTVRGPACVRYIFPVVSLELSSSDARRRSTLSHWLLPAVRHSGLSLSSPVLLFPCSLANIHQTDSGTSPLHNFLRRSVMQYVRPYAVHDTPRIRSSTCYCKCVGGRAPRVKTVRPKAHQISLINILRRHMVSDKDFQRMQTSDD